MGSRLQRSRREDSAPHHFPVLAFLLGSTIKRRSILFDLAAHGLD
jgi:hypothetical protein